MQSWLWQLGRDEGEARGRAEGEARALRTVCADLVRELHPRVAARVLPAVESCDRPEALRAWIIQCPKLTGAQFAALVTGQPAEPVVRSRTSRPSRALRGVPRGRGRSRS
jgi:hypothetical protein